MALVRKVFLGLIVLILLIGVGGFFLPSTGHVERSVVVNASADTVFDVLRDFKQFNAWSPWYDLDPDARYEQSGPDGNVGSRFAWLSDKREVGNGSQTITRLERPDLVELRLEFEGQTPADSAFILEPSGSGTKVTWTLDSDFGANPYLHYFSVLLDRFVGPAYEKGLAQLKVHVESQGAIQ